MMRQINGINFLHMLRGFPSSLTEPLCGVPLGGVVLSVTCSPGGRGDSHPAVSLWNLKTANTLFSLRVNVTDEYQLPGFPEKCNRYFT